MNSNDATAQQTARSILRYLRWRRLVGRLVGRLTTRKKRLGSRLILKIASMKPTMLPQHVPLPPSRLQKRRVARPDSVAAFASRLDGNRTLMSASLTYI